MNAYKSKVIEAFRQLVDPQPVAVSHCGQSSFFYPLGASMLETF